MKSVLAGLMLLCLFASGVWADDSYDAAQIQKCIYDNLNALNAEDMKAAMDTIHPDSPGNLSTAQSLPYIFQYYDLKYSIEAYQLQSIEGDYAKVRVVQTTRKIKGDVFRDNRIDVVHTLRRYNGFWYLWDSTLLNTVFLN